VLHVFEKLVSLDLKKRGDDGGSEEEGEVRGGKGGG
jgi:hypothetical protein